MSKCELKKSMVKLLWMQNKISPLHTSVIKFPFDISSHKVIKPIYLKTYRYTSGTSNLILKS